MPRPTIDEEDLARLTDVVDARTKVPAEHLGVAERILFVLDELEDADARADHLADRVEMLEEQLEEAREETVGESVATGTTGTTGLSSNRGGRGGSL